MLKLCSCCQLCAFIKPAVTAVYSEIRDGRLGKNITCCFTVIILLKCPNTDKSKQFLLFDLMEH